MIAGQPQAELVAPGHPLLEAMVDVVLERFQPLLVQGGVLVDEADESIEPRLLVYLEHAIRDGRSGRSGEPRAISQRLQFIFLKEDGTAVDGGPAPYLDCRPITAEERALVADAIAAPWLSGHVESQALGYAIQSLVPQHLDEVKTRRIVEIDKVEREVRARLRARSTIGTPAPPGCANRSAPAKSSASTPRMRRRRRLGWSSGCTSGKQNSTVSGRFRRCPGSQGRRPGDSGRAPQGASARSANARTEAGRLLGRPGRPRDDREARDGCRHGGGTHAGQQPRDVSAEKKGYDIESRDPRAGHLRFIEVKGRHADGRE